MCDVNASRREEQICAEVMLEENLVSLEHREYRGSDQGAGKFPQQESSGYRSGCHPWRSAKTKTRESWDGLEHLPPIPISCRRHAGFGREEGEFFKQVAQDWFCFFAEGEQANQPGRKTRRLNGMWL